jgi:8-oxo-dGTP pyrophosphatase MutT (NUDIX family)
MADDPTDPPGDPALPGLPPRPAPDAPGSPWRTLGAREVYRNPWLRVTEYQVIRPDGTLGIYGVADPGDNAAIVALDDAERVTLVGEFLYPLQTFAWMIPSGMVNAGEAPLAAAQRELEEETGLQAAEWTPLGAYYLSAGISPQTSHAFLARGLRAVPARPEGTERLTLRQVPLAEARALCLRNEIRDVVSVAALWRAWELLHGAEQG